MLYTQSPQDEDEAHGQLTASAKVAEAALLPLPTSSPDSFQSSECILACL